MAAAGGPGRAGRPRARRHASTATNTSGQLRIGYLPITDAAPLLIAHAAGLYQPGVVSAAKPVLFRSWAALAEAFVTRQVDVVHLLMPMAVQLRYTIGAARVRVLGWNHTNGSALTVAPARHRKPRRQLAGTPGGHPVLVVDPQHHSATAVCAPTDLRAGGAAQRLAQPPGRLS